MESLMLAWGESQSWWGTFASLVVVANAITLAVKDQYAEKLPIIGKIFKPLKVGKTVTKVPII